MAGEHQRSYHFIELGLTTPRTADASDASHTRPLEMKLTFNAPDGRSCTLVLDGPETLDDVHAILEVELGMPSSQQNLSVKGTHVVEGTVGDNFKEGDVVDVRPPAPSSAAAGAGSSSAASSSSHARAGGGGGRHRGGAGAGRVRLDPAIWSSLTWNDLPGNLDVPQLHAILGVNPTMMAEIEKRDPDLWAAASDRSGPAKLSAVLMRRNLERALPEAERGVKLRQLENRLAANPFDVEAQTLLEEIITQKNVDDNWEMAYEHMPEGFTRVHMLYVDAKVNGVHIKVFVDSGAQTTILSKKAAQRCGIMRLVDVKYAGMAVGVGSAPIIGRVHMAREWGVGVGGGQDHCCVFGELPSDLWLLDCPTTPHSPSPRLQSWKSTGRTFPPLSL